MTGWWCGIWNIWPLRDRGTNVRRVTSVCQRGIRSPCLSMMKLESGWPRIVIAAQQHMSEVRLRINPLMLNRALKFKIVGGSLRVRVINLLKRVSLKPILRSRWCWFLLRVEKICTFVTLCCCPSFVIAKLHFWLDAITAVQPPGCCRKLIYHQDLLAQNATKQLRKLNPWLPGLVWSVV